MRNITPLEETKSVVLKYVEAFNRGHLDALRALFTEDAEIQSVLGKGLR